MALIFTNFWFHVAILLFQIFSLAIFLRPLLQVSRSRCALFLLFSKAFGMFVGLLISSAFLLFICLQLEFGEWFPATFNVISIIPQISTRIHLVVMAVNRVHCVYFPLKYAKQAKRRNIMKICSLIWLISTILTLILLIILPSQLLIFQLKLPIFANNFLKAMAIYTYRVQNIYQFCIFSSFLLYLCLLWKFSKMKRQNNKSSGSSASNNPAEKDHFKISIVFILGLIPYIVQMVTAFFLEIVFLEINQSDTLLYAIQSIQIISSLLCPIMEEICLMIACQDFRELFLKQFNFINKLKTITIGGHGNIKGKNPTIPPMFTINTGGKNNNKMKIDATKQQSKILKYEKFTRSVINNAKTISNDK